MFGGFTVYGGFHHAFGAVLLRRDPFRIRSLHRIDTARAAIIEIYGARRGEQIPNARAFLFEEAGLHLAGVIGLLGFLEHIRMRRKGQKQQKQARCKPL